MKNLKYDHKISQQNICQNYEAIKNFIEGLEEDKFKNFLLENCEVVYIVLDNIEEAFQFFDSQNARGKSLEGYDLLKAFHLREMKENTEGEKIEAVKKWETVSEKNEKETNLKVIFDDLFAIRKYSRGEKVGRDGFTKKDVDEFKGFNPSENHYPYIKSYIMNDLFLKKNKKDFENLSLLMSKQEKINYPFQINMQILNGKRFFEYVQFYIDLKEKLKKEEKLELKHFLSATGGTGDQYVSHLFQRILLFYYDKFGDSDLEKTEKYLFVWAYTLRQQYAVRFSSVDNYSTKCNSLFNRISNSLYHYGFAKNPTQQEFDNWINGINKKDGRTGSEELGLIFKKNNKNDRQSK